MGFGHCPVQLFFAADERDIHRVALAAMHVHRVLRRSA